MQPAPELPVSAKLDVDALVQAEPDQVQRLLDGGLLVRHASLHPPPAPAAAAPPPAPRLRPALPGPLPDLAHGSGALQAAASRSSRGGGWSRSHPGGAAPGAAGAAQRGAGGGTAGVGPAGAGAERGGGAGAGARGRRGGGGNGGRAAGAAPPVAFDSSLFISIHFHLAVSGLDVWISWESTDLILAPPALALCGWKGGLLSVFSSTYS